MQAGSLKKGRVLISILFFLLILALFIDIRSFIPIEVHSYILFLQFIPSVIKSTVTFTLYTTGFILIILLTLAFGRVYCSSICPLGTLQDLFSFIYKKLKKKKDYQLLNSYKWLRYLILIASVISIVSGSLLLINLIDPYSNFGRICSSLIKPVIILLNNSSGFLLEKVDIYYLYQIDIKGLTTLKIIFPLLFLILILVMVLKGRLFCNMICPVGALLGIVSKISLFRISIKGEKCKGCRLCERVCKAGCIDRINKNVDFERCVLCFNCLTVCPSEGINYTRNFLIDKQQETDYKKREFITKTLIYFFSLSGIALSQVKIIPKKKSKVPVYKKYPVTPPGSKSIKHFTKKCTACHLCISVCPTQVLQPSYLEYGFTGMLQPYMDYNSGFCNFDCVICSEVCPSGAIKNILAEKKKLTQLGKSKFIKENCIVETENTACGACSEHCPTKAVKMVPYKNIHIPEIEEKYCIGCGACEYACPVKPYKAIYVEGNYYHQIAEKPKEEKPQEADYQEDFPF
jgi:polyferredoxin